MMTKRNVFVLSLFLVLALLLVSSAPADAGSQWSAEPSGFGVWHNWPDQDAHPNANVWENMTLNAGVGQGTCWVQIRYGTYGTPGNMLAYSQMRWISGGCSWGGIDLAYVNGWGNYVHLLSDESQKCVANTLSTQGLYCVQLGDGSVWVQRGDETRPSQPLAAKAVICQSSVNGGKYCLRKTVSINF